MRFTTLSIVLLGLSASSALARTTRDERAASPAPAPASSRPRLRNLLKELTARAKYPDLFRSKKRDTQQSHYVCTDICPQYPGVFIDCEWEPGPDPSEKKREVIPSVEVILEPEQAAAFFLGQGSYEHKNGSAIVDYDFVQAGLDRRARALKRWKLHDWVRSTLGNAVMDLGMPIYSKWRRHFADQPEYEFVLSDTHAFRMGDLEAIEAALLGVPDWEEFELGEWRITRMFLQVAHDLK